MLRTTIGLVILVLFICASVPVGQWFLPGAAPHELVLAGMCAILCTIMVLVMLWAIAHTLGSVVMLLLGLDD